MMKRAPVMQRAPWVVAAMAVMMLSGVVSAATAADVSFGFFYSNLSPYGSWAVSANYGRVWRPVEYAPGWNPYYDGHWVYTDLGWTWVSDYAWGAIPYHYGTWEVDPALGWVWIPGYVWAPSWVVFSTGPDYIGWAPVPPRFVVGASIGVNVFATNRCVVVPARSFMATRVRACAVPGAVARGALPGMQVVNNITVRNHVVVNGGPDPRGVSKAAGYDIRPMPISRVRNATPSGRFDPVEVRADRHGGGGALRAAAPEPARRQEAAQRHEAVQRSEARAHQPAVQPAHQSSAARRPEPARGQTGPGHAPAEHAGAGHEAAHGTHAPNTAHGTHAPNTAHAPNAAQGPNGHGQAAGNHSQPPKPGKPQQKPAHGGKPAGV